MGGPSVTIWTDQNNKVATVYLSTLLLSYTIIFEKDCLWTVISKSVIILIFEEKGDPFCDYLLYHLFLYCVSPGVTKFYLSLLRQKLHLIVDDCVIFSGICAFFSPLCSWVFLPIIQASESVLVVYTVGKSYQSKKRFIYQDSFRSPFRKCTWKEDNREGLTF